MKSDKVYGLIYSATNKVNGKKYVGQTTQSLHVRIQNHRAKAANPHLSAAFTKHGHGSFEWKILAMAANQRELDCLENFYILELETMDRSKGYNFREGGAHGKLSEDAKRKISISKLGKPLSEEHRQKLSKAREGLWSNENNPRYGKGDEIQGVDNPMYGKKHSAESRKKMSETLKGREGFCGQSNPMWQKVPPNAKKVLVFRENKLVGEFPSIAQAAKFLDRHQSVVVRYMNGSRKSPEGIRLEWA